MFLSSFLNRGWKRNRSYLFTPTMPTMMQETFKPQMRNPHVSVVSNKPWRTSPSPSFTSSPATKLRKVSGTIGPLCHKATWAHRGPPVRAAHPQGELFNFCTLESWVFWVNQVCENCVRTHICMFQYLLALGLPEWLVGDHIGSRAYVYRNSEKCMYVYIYICIYTPWRIPRNGNVNPKK